MDSEELEENRDGQPDPPTRAVGRKHKFPGVSIQEASDVKQIRPIIMAIYPVEDPDSQQAASADDREQATESKSAEPRRGPAMAGFASRLSRCGERGRGGAVCVHDLPRMMLHTGAAWRCGAIVRDRN